MQRKILVSETTREERRDIVDGAIAITSLSDLPIHKEVLRIAEQYVEGIVELDAVKAAVKNVIESCREEKNK